MKKPLAACSAILLTGCLSNAFAASSVDLSVSGVITPSACTPGLSSNGNIDLGKISAVDLKQDTNTVLPRRTLRMSIDCDASTLFALQGTDNRASSSTASTGYGLGLIDNTQKIGRYYLLMANSVADTAVVAAMESFDGGVTWMELDDAIWQRNNLAAFGAGLNGPWVPIPIKALTTDLVVAPMIAPAKDLNLANEVQIDGSATLTIQYL
ncbi:DUF1120 domain-containing protein [Pseudomonas sp. MH9.3]|uniref:DUF1120 domain-containing protein n=1 Tax=Pseudomonas sp. MH9.3 TaxID=3048630 RepID=UPI002AC95828|nr:DUF1120 domain-containing protein [Pseudomonas sp. MH9.3]MEB0105978.1 DUF1120 domain-containing protein [Pseudomonas sp. MH9.3]WPX78785.1 DUF1120 domain-containing protein [Pseudomonas sp. MH9.3]WQG58824.1 DUF1120 domain-containing protein [Pseudomonas sp. RTB3]